MKLTTKDILKMLTAGAIILSTPLIPPLPMILVEIQKVWKDINKRDIGRIVKRLERQEMIAIREVGNKVSIEITDKGRKRLLKYDFENIERKAKTRDGKWRLIIFDIPEYKKRNRDAFRRKLIELECIRLQDSVFVSAFPCKEEIDFLTHYLEISDFVTVVILEKIERGEQLLFKEYKDPMEQ